MSKIIVSLTAVLALITGASSGIEVTLNPSEDASIYAGLPDANYGSWNTA